MTTGHLVLAKMRWRWFGLALLLWLVDQAVKYQVMRTMQLYESIPIVAGFNWVFVMNAGAAFSFLADAGGWQRYFLSVVAMGVTVALVAVLWRGVASKLDALAYALLIAGAMGNATDRVRHGAVVDYVDLYWQSWHWPAFNIADICISLAALILIFGELLNRRGPVQSGKSRAT